MKNRPRLTNGLIPLALIALILGAAGCVDRNAQAQNKETLKVVSDPTTAVAVESAKQMDVPDLISIPGSVKTADDVQLSSKASGRIAEIYIHEGDLVRAGQVVARMDPVEANAKLGQARAGVAQAVAELQQVQTDAASAPTRSSATERGAQARLAGAQQALARLVNGSRPEEKIQAQANLDKAKSDLDFAQKNYDRQEMLYKSDAIAKADLEAAQNKLDQAKSAYVSVQQQFALVKTPNRAEDIAQAQQQVRSAEEDLKNAQATKKNDPIYAQRVTASRAQVANANDQVRLAQQAVNDLNIISPKGGKVVGSPLQPGTVVGVGQAIARLVNLESVYFEGESPEDLVTKIHPGQVARVKIDALGDVVLDGVVRSIDAVASSTGRLYNVRIDMPENHGLIKSNMFGTANIELSVEHGATTVPAISVVSRDNVTYVFTVSGGKATKKIVKTGNTIGERIVVSGISSTDQVVTRGQDTLTDGAPVKIDTGGGTATATTTTAKGA